MAWATIPALLSVLVASPAAHAAIIVPSASAETTVTEVDGGFEYSYTITNTSDEGGPNLFEWAMPFFDDAATSFVDGEASIFAPDGWTWIFAELTSGSPDAELWGYLAADDPKNDTYGAPGTAFDNPPYALVFYTLSSTDWIAPGASLGGFGYVSPFAGTNVPFIAGYDDFQLTIGDPVAPQTPTFPGVQGVPEPASLTLVGLGAICLVAGAVRRRRQRITAD